MAKDKVVCPRCGSEKFSKATDKSGKLYCQSCAHVWVPGTEGLTNAKARMQQLQIENEELKAALDKERKEVKRLTDKYEPETGPDIFD